MKKAEYGWFELVPETLEEAELLALPKMRPVQVTQEEFAAVWSTLVNVSKVYISMNCDVGSVYVNDVLHALGLKPPEGDTNESR